MAWSNLSQVTSTLINLLTANINRLAGVATVSVVPTPPDRLADAAPQTLSLYLYHVRESIASQNLTGGGADVPDVATVPLGLELFYVLTAHQARDGNYDALAEQELIGYALKTLHDNPSISSATTIPGWAAPIMVGGDPQNDVLHVEFRKVESEQSFAIWTTGERQFTRLAAYFQVGLVLLQPEPAKSVSNLVYSLGTVVTPTAAPSLAGSRSQMTFELPPSLGGGQRTIPAIPARPASSTTPGAVSSLVLVGAGLSSGLARRVVLRSPRWARRVPSLPRIPVDPALNMANGWSFDFHADRVEVTIGTTLSYQPEDGGPTATIPVWPGSYSASIESTVAEQVVAGVLRRRTARSNETTFGIAARITGHAVDAVAQSITLAIDTPFEMWAPPAAPPADPLYDDPLEIELAIDGEVYLRDDSGPPAAGHFQVKAGSIVVGATFGVTTPALHSVRLLVEGVDSHPYWIPIP